jgi:hypothetical protein
MKKYFFITNSIIRLLGLTSATFAQGVTIEKGAFFRAEENTVIVVEGGKLTNHGIADLDSARLRLIGSENVTLDGSVPWQIGSLELALEGSLLMLTAPTKITETVEFMSGNLDLNGQNLTLDPKAKLIGESEESRIIGPKGGEVIITLPMNAPVFQNPGNLGVSITSGKNLGDVTIRRGHQPQEVETGKSIERYFYVASNSPDMGSAKIRLHYFDAEIGSQDETELKIIQRAAESLRAWKEKKTAENNLNDNFVEAGKVKELGLFTLVVQPRPTEQKEEENTLSNQHLDMVLYPVPVVGNTATLSVNSPVSGEGTLKIFGMDGKLFQTRSVDLAKGNNSFTIDITELTTSTYILILETLLGPQSVRFVK